MIFAESCLAPQWPFLKMRRPTFSCLKTALNTLMTVPSIVKVGLRKQGDKSYYPRVALSPHVSAHRSHFRGKGACDIYESPLDVRT